MMAGKQILGDDPFSTAEGEAPPPPLAPATPKKESAKKESAKRETAPKEAAPKEHAVSDAAPAVETYSPVEPTPPSPYGPSIDRPPPTGHRHGLVEEVKQLEKSVRDRILPSRRQEEPEARTKLPLEFLWQRWRKLAMRDRSDVVDEFGRDPNVAAKVDP
ncbi:MAG: hypothetical protein LC659_01920, partial [Myxococcales bacterium]|nr:hypothetical protein [Myxococcales bacterium]